MMRNKDFVVLILSHGRADRVYTYNKLRVHGYTGRIVIVLDNEDDSVDEYARRYGADNVVVFDKEKVAETFDEVLRGDRRTIVYARNASFDIVRGLGYRYFIQLDDDYTSFCYRFDHRLRYKKNAPAIKNLDGVFDCMLDYYKSIPAKSIAMAQGGDFIGGSESNMAKVVRLLRKAMNSFICDTYRPFQFIGRLNEDVTTYTLRQSIGDLFFTVNQVSLNQKQTQSNKGGITEVYKESGALAKPFMSIVCMPSSIKVGLVGNHHSSNQRRLHHVINWNNTVPRIINEKYKRYDKK